MALVSINPATGEEIQTYSEHSELEVQKILDQTVEAQKKWAATDLEFRLILPRAKKYRHTLNIHNQRSSEYWVKQLKPKKSGQLQT